MSNCLIIDDDPLLRKMASDILTAHGFSVFEAATGQEGLERASAGDADIVLLDLVLPDACGLDLLPKLSGGVIVTTSQFSLDSALKALRNGAGDYLPKPFCEETLLMSVERVLKRQTLERENRELSAQNAKAITDLKRSREELFRWSRQLEQIVEERTRALKQSNRARQIAYRDLEQSHRKLKQAQATLVGREKMAALGLLAAGVAHEINSPLSFVNANLDSLKQYVRSLRRLSGVVIHARARAGRDSSDRVERILKEAGRVIDEEKLREVLDDLGPLFEEMANGLTRITGIVEQLRGFAEDGSAGGSCERVDLNAEVRRLVELIHGPSAESLHIECRLGAVPHVLVPVRTLRQVLLNLLTPGAREAGDLRKLILRTDRQNGRVVLDLLDPSSRMSEEEMGRMFDPFYEPSGDQQLGGLGLSAAYGLARTMGGALRAFNQLPGGVCIQLSLPAVEETGAGEGEPAR